LIDKTRLCHVFHPIQISSPANITEDVRQNETDISKVTFMRSFWRSCTFKQVHQDSLELSVSLADEKAGSARPDGLRDTVAASNIAH
jgi:hypothetical protein